MQKFLLSLILSFSFVTFSIDSYALSEEQLAEITSSLENLSTDELIERRELLLAQLDDHTDVDELEKKIAVDVVEIEAEVKAKVAEDDTLKLSGDEEEKLKEEAKNAMLAEISVIEAILAALGILMIDNVTEDSSTPPDTVSPVVTVTGDNPATVELGATYSDAGATSDGGETVVSSGTVDTSTVGSYTIKYSATDAAGNVGTATRTVNVVDLSLIHI